MNPEPKDWLDIPDPLEGAALGAGRAPAPPAAKSPTRDDMKRRRIVALLGSFAWAAAVLAFFGLREGLADHAGFVAAQSVVWGALFVAAVALALSKGRRGLGAAVGWARALAAGAPIAFMMAALFWLPASAASFGDLGDVASLVACFSVGIGVAVPLVALFVWSVRRSFPSAADWRGALLGAASGLGAALVLTLHCSSVLGGHVALAHGMPLVLAALAGGWLGNRVARS
jgi:hypothetical protein